MTPLTEIGEMVITDGDRDYFFRPSLANMTRIGTPGEIVERFTELHHNDAPRLIQAAIEAYGVVPEWLVKHINTMGGESIKAAMVVMQACCDEDVGHLVGELRPGKTGKRAFVYRLGKIPVHDLIILAQSLITHGIIGKAKVRRLQRHESSAFVSEFNAFEYISAARSHFGISREEAQNLTMTEFTLLLASKYPNEKGFTKEEYQQVTEDYLAKKNRRLAAAKQN